MKSSKKILMFGWEFPPHISGGLGTACYGLTRGLSGFDDIELKFVVPKAYGDEDQSNIKIIGASDVPLSTHQLKFDDIKTSIEYTRVQSEIIPYTSPDEFWELKSKKYSRQQQFVETNNEGKIQFTGKYGNSLIDEIYKYALVGDIIARKDQYDIIHAHDWLTYPAGIAAKKATNCPLVVHVHATDFDRSGGNVNPKVYAIEREGMEFADCIITVSNLTRQIVIEKYGIDPSKVKTIYNAVEPHKVDDYYIPQKRTGEKIVTFLGRITLQKGPGYFVEAAYQVLLRDKNVRFVMAGSGDMMDAMVRRVAQLGIADHFHFTGFLQNDDVFKLFAMSDVYIMPSVSEPFGISPLEAMQNNVPVIISKQSGVAEILNHVLKIDFWDIHAMADAIHALISYPVLKKVFKENARAEVQKLQWKNSARCVREVYHKLLKHKNK